MITNFELSIADKIAIFEIIYPQIIAECKKRKAQPVRIGTTWTEYISRYGDWVVVWYGFEINGVVDCALIQAKIDDLNTAFKKLAKETKAYELPELHEN